MVKAFRDLGHEVKVVGPAGETTAQSSEKSRLFGWVKRALPRTLFELLEIVYTVYAFAATSWQVFRFRPDFIYDRYITFNAGTILAGMLSRTNLLLEVNAPLALERSSEKDEGLRFRRFARTMERWVCAHATRTIVVSTPLKGYLESIGVPAGKIVVMPNGVDPQQFLPREQDLALRTQLAIPESSFVVGFTGVLRAWHGLDLLISAVANLVNKGIDVSLLIVGGGIHRDTLERMIDERGLRRAVHITGRVPHERVPDYVSLFDVAVSPRATFYASPMKVVEYMALGKPVVVPRTANFLDMIDDRINGVTFIDGSVPDLETTLEHLYRSPDVRRSLGMQARRKVENRLNWTWNALASCALVESPRSGHK
jgi:glycosyltransferase involved in cell wall biosynthesis